MEKCKNTECINSVKNKNIYCSLKCRNIYVNKHLRNYQANSNGLSKEKKYLLNPKKCLSCNELIMYSKKRNKFCSSKCSTSFNNLGRKQSAETKNKIGKSNSIAITKKWMEPNYFNKCFISLGKRRFNSKGEIEVRRHLLEKFPEHYWTTGCLTNIGTKSMLTGDIFSKKLKICIEYDGIWHFKDIHGQLERKQKKDKELEEWCLNNGYRIIRIKEEVYKKNKPLLLSLLEQEILYGTKQYIAFYE